MTEISFLNNCTMKNFVSMKSTFEYIRNFAVLIFLRLINKELLSSRVFCSVCSEIWLMVFWLHRGSESWPKRREMRQEGRVPGGGEKRERERELERDRDKITSDWCYSSTHDNFTVMGILFLLFSSSRVLIHVCWCSGCIGMFRNLINVRIALWNVGLSNFDWTDEMKFF